MENRLIVTLTIPSEGLDSLAPSDLKEIRKIIAFCLWNLKI